ncbi:MAG: DNA-processing protein DprA [Alphaproteobacteria bacterium]|nr:DNA-processing protein DprA [Alphaproteobacteria bacterium]
MTPRATPDRVAWIRLARTEGVGPAAFAHLLARFGDAATALEALPDLARESGRSLTLATRAEAEREIAAGEKCGARLLLSADPDFPALLAANEPPPPVLWVRGDPAWLSRPAVAVVGSREASAAGLSLARDLAAGLGRAGWVVVSGLARGIDAAAHEGALGGGTIAVLAGGVDAIYPPQNARLYAALVERGCILSERAIGHAAKARDFPRRNRIIAGLARGVVVVEAELRSGSLITARLAAEQGREVFAVPGHPSDPRARGVNALIREGAILVEDAGDVIAALDALPPLAFQRPTSPKNVLTRSRPDSVPMSDPHPGPTEAPAIASEEDTGSLMRRIDALLSPAPTSFDQIVRATGAPLPEVMAALSELNLAGRAEFRPGGAAVRL